MARPSQTSAQELEIPAGGVMLPASLWLPSGSRVVVVFVHGSGSSRFSHRNRAVAQELQQAGLGTLLFDLLTAEEGVRDQRDRSLRFDMSLLSDRLVAVLDALGACEPLGSQALGLFGASTGAAAALDAAAHRPDQVGAVVSRGGRPDLVVRSLGDVVCPTLLLVGSHDLDVLELNSWAAQQLQGPHELRVIPGAGHLFEEPGTLDVVAAAARDWFLKYLPITVDRHGAVQYDAVNVTQIGRL